MDVLPNQNDTVPIVRRFFYARANDERKGKDRTMKNAVHKWLYQ